MVVVVGPNDRECEWKELGDAGTVEEEPARDETTEAKEDAFELFVEERVGVGSKEWGECDRERVQVTKENNWIKPISVIVR